MDSNSIKKIILEISGFIFYLYELYKFYTVPQRFSIYDFSSEILYLKFIMLLFALPLLYIFRLADFFDWGDVLDKDNNSNYLQVKMFYYAINIILFIFLFFEAVEYIYKIFI